MYASLAFGSTKIFATRPKFIVVVAAADEARDLSFLVAGAGARLAARALLADLQQELAVLGELQDVESGPPLPPIQTLPLWSMKMPWLPSGHS